MSTLHNAFYVRWRAGYGWVTSAPRPVFAEVQELLRGRAFVEPELGDPHTLATLTRNGVLYAGFVGATKDARERAVRHYHVVVCPGAVGSPENERRLLDAFRALYGEVGDGKLERITEQLTSGQPADSRGLLASLEIRVELEAPRNPFEEDDDEHTDVMPAVEPEPAAPAPRRPQDTLPFPVQVPDRPRPRRQPSLPPTVPPPPAALPAPTAAVEPPRPNRKMALPALLVLIGGLLVLIVGAAVLFADVDGDGHTTAMLFGDDCDDQRADVYPGADERPADGVDGNCDGEELCYKDLDGDGHGQGELALSRSVACAGGGVSARADDCDDANAERSPSTREIAADGLDQDCDDKDACHVDADGDGWGTDVLVAMDRCGVGHTGRGGDCDDGDERKHPEAKGRGDGVDRDCDGVVSGDEVRPPPCGPGKPNRNWRDTNGNDIRDCLEDDPADAIPLKDKTAADAVDPVSFWLEVPKGTCESIVLEWTHPGTLYNGRRRTVFSGGTARCQLETPGVRPRHRVCGGGKRRQDEIEYTWYCRMQAFKAVSPTEMRDLPIASGRITVVH